MKQAINFNEIGSIQKRRQDRIKIVLIYPNTYHVGMSNLGFQTVYRLLNAIDHVVCERAFLPEPVTYKGTSTGKSENDLRTVESKSRLNEFDLIAFSISFENDYLNIPTILEKAGFPIRAIERSRNQPLVAVGGVACFLNPEPIAAFIDFFLIGEAETIIPDFIRTFDPDLPKPEMLHNLAAHVSGAYVPAFYRPEYNPDGTPAKFITEASAPNPVKRQTAAEIGDSPAHSVILTKNTTFKNTFLIEVTRGCPHGCRFCSAGYIYRPPRFMDPNRLKALIKKGGELTGHIGLVGAAVTDVPQIDELCYEIRDKKINISFSSLRADGLSDDLITVLKESRLKTATIAPDAGSERMRNVINKGMNADQILKATETLVSAGIPNLKLYFMVGLPTETMEDIEAIAQLCKRIKDQFLRTSRPQKRIGTITVSLNAFVPKPFTPFQWEAMDSIKTLKKKIQFLKKHLNKIPNMRLQAESPRKAYVQALLSRGDRNVSKIILAVHKNSGNWPQTLSENNFNTDFYVTRRRPLDECLPWDFIDHGLDKAYLIKELERALSATPSPPCPMKSCSVCGVC